MSGGSSLWVQRVFLLAAILAAWEACARLVSDRWISSPVAIAGRLAQWVAGDLWYHLAVTATENTAKPAASAPSTRTGV